MARRAIGLLRPGMGWTSDCKVAFGAVRSVKRCCRGGSLRVCGFGHEYVRRSNWGEFAGRRVVVIG